MMNDIAIASMDIASARLAVGYAMALQKNVMSDMEQQAMNELEMLPPVPSLGEYIDTYA